MPTTNYQNEYRDEYQNEYKRKYQNEYRNEYRDEYLTLSALGDGEIVIVIPASINQAYATSLSYSEDKSEWVKTDIDDTNQTISIPVSKGDSIYLKGEAKQLYESGDDSSVYIDSSANISASGNIMSLLYGDEFKGKTSFPTGSQRNFAYLFGYNEHLLNTENLILPATELTNGCYSSMFEGCTFLDTAPVLPATKLVEQCYGMMFGGCNKLNSITILATDISAEDCLIDWVDGVAPAGTFAVTFTKIAPMTLWSIGASGVPDNWTIVDYENSKFARPA